MAFHTRYGVRSPGVGYFHLYPHSSGKRVPEPYERPLCDSRRGGKELEDRFVKEAAAAGLVNLAGHRLMGGMRASIYNAMPIEGVRALIDFMKKFEGANGR